MIMRIAVCISGAQRLANNALTYFSRQLPVEAEVDYFAYMWGGDYASEEELSQAITDKIEGRVGKIRVKIDNSFTPTIIFPFTQFPETNVENVMRMFYGIKKANDMKTFYEIENKFRYDVVVRQRSDVGLASHLDFHKFLTLVEHFVVFPEDGHWRGGLNDQFAFSSSTNMDVYASVYNFIQDHCMHGCPLHPETLVRFHLNKMRKDPILAPLNAVILRD
jgi:hypothetical protein